MQPHDQEPALSRAEPPAGDPGQPLPDAVYRLDRARRISHVTLAGESLLSRPAAELLGRNVLDSFPGIRGTVVEDAITAVLGGAQARVFDYRHEPWEHWFEFRVYPDSQGVTVIVRDIDERMRADEAQAGQARQLTAVLETLPSATVLVGDDGRILTANRAWVTNGELLRSAGITPGGIGDDYVTCMSRGLDPEDHRAIAAGLDRLLNGADSSPTGIFDYEYSSRLGSFTAWFQLQAARVADSRRVVVTHSDITARVRGEQALAWQATHDELTGLANRAALLRLIGAALDATDAQRTALLVLDLDGFKTVNDSLGHQLGDALLCQVAGRLVEQVRPGDAVGRLGGDQFVVLARDCDSDEAATLGFRLQASFAVPFESSGITVPLSASIGVAVSRDGIRDPHQLLSDADAAMFAAKSSGRDRVHLFSPVLREAARWRLEVASRLRDDAIDQLVVHYQPVVRLDTGEVEGVEALVRWQHPERGLLSPDSFLSVAEETGQVIPITRWLLQETTRRAAEWTAQGLPLRMSVNVSARHFSAETLVRDVRVALRESGLPPDQLVIELTETCVAEDPTRAEDQLTVLRSFGVRVAIDDFGTGWSSLAQLFALPISILKIDRSLLNAAERAAAGESGAVLAAIVGLTRTLGIRSVAEGVETAEHLRLVRAAGCDLAQGWLLGHAMPAEQVPGWVRAVKDAGGDLCALAVAREASCDTVRRAG
ncbi:MAG TPA: EAL domain-containing protein [Blastococcus sp.]|nr:EAL domain-containing protein [Blastococcus sp.]